jgi:hypothetical protein
MATITGRVEIRVSGQLLLSKKGATLQFGGPERKPIVEDQYHGFVDELQPAVVTVNLTDRDDISITNLCKVTDATIFFEAINGKSYILRNATCKGNPTLTAGEGEVSMEFFAEGPPEEITA